MNITAALTHEQGVTFAVVLVKSSAMQAMNRDETQAAFRTYFPGVPIVLASQRHNGSAEYYGRRDIVAWLSNIFFEQLPWAEYRAA
jgi:hypothetical protein